MNKSRLIVIMAVVAAVALCFSGTAGAADVERMSKEELKGMLNNPDVIIVDVRQPGDYSDTETKIQGAVRENPRSVRQWMDKYPKDKTLVFYCA
jgi:rhodanese-related sulfurtransferase